MVTPKYRHLILEFQVSVLGHSTYVLHNVMYRLRVYEAISSGISSLRERSAATVVTYSQESFLINSNRLRVSASQPTEHFTEKTMQYLG